MTKEQQRLCRGLIALPKGERARQHDVADFLQQFPTAVQGDGKAAASLLREACEQRDAESLACALIVMDVFGYGSEHLTIARALLGADWHWSHQEIARMVSLQCPNCHEHAADPDSDELSGIQRFVCSRCEHEFFLHSVELVTAPAGQQTEWLACSFRPADPANAAKAYLQIRKIVERLSPRAAAALEQQYADGAEHWHVGSLPRAQAEQLVSECAALGWVIQCGPETD